MLVLVCILSAGMVVGASHPSGVKKAVHKVTHGLHWVFVGNQNQKAKKYGTQKY